MGTPLECGAVFEEAQPRAEDPLDAALAPRKHRAAQQQPQPPAKPVSLDLLLAIASAVFSFVTLLITIARGGGGGRLGSSAPNIIVVPLPVGGDKV